MCHHHLATPSRRAAAACRRRSTLRFGVRFAGMRCATLAISLNSRTSTSVSCVALYFEVLDVPFALGQDVMSCHVTSLHLTSPHPTLPCPALPCPALPCPALPCLALPYLTLPYLTPRHLASLSLSLFTAHVYRDGKECGHSPARQIEACSKAADDRNLCDRTHVPGFRLVKRASSPLSLSLSHSLSLSPSRSFSSSTAAKFQICNLPWRTLMCAWARPGEPRSAQILIISGLLNHANSQPMFLQMLVLFVSV